MADLYIGLMSGTSLDGLDGVLADLADLADSDAGRIRVLSHAHSPFEAALASELLALNSSGSDELHRSALAANALARLGAQIVARLLDSAGRTPADVRAIGSHGQTVRHCPGEIDGTGYTVQLNNAALLAELTGIDVVADFRSRDVAAGGQGAPLVPAFHRAVFGSKGTTVGVLNIGGMSNLTILRPDGHTFGFDCGPGNVLMDLWCQRHLGRAFDADGSWAAGGRVDNELLTRLQAEPFFDAAPPKSTGRDRFNGAWLESRLAGQHGDLPEIDPRDVQATLLELTAWSCARDLQRHAPDAGRLLVCGGGAFNAQLMLRLAARLPGVPVTASDTAGLPANQVEALAFAWLARACVLRQAGNLPAVTGARGERILGAVYPGR
ncbi:MAG: anhydro-N-acetylmuramic acid kinase [Ideonella sp.]